MNHDLRTAFFSVSYFITVVVLLSGSAAPAQESVDESDLIARIRDCEVLTVTGDEFDAIFTVTGTVVSPDGDPVADAIVVLRESSTKRISRESKKYLYVKDRHLLRAQDVFARTTTDREGKFEFREAKSPAMPKTNSSSYWQGDVVAAHESLGVGWLGLAGKKEKRRVDSDLTVVLRPTGSISGRFVSPAKLPIENGMIRPYRLVKPTQRAILGDDLDLQMSQLAPRVWTDSSGRFTMTGIPAGLVAVASVYHPDWMQNGVAIATSEDVATGKREAEYLRDLEVQAVPAELIADPGIVVPGQVIDSQGKPVPDATVSYSSHIDRETTDQDGKFRLRIAASWLDRDRKRGTTSKLYAFAKPDSGFLSRHQEEPIDDLAAGRAVSIQLEQGVSVRGKILTDEGEPVADAYLRPVSDSNLSGAITKDDGSYELLVPAGQHVIVVGTDAPGYALPRRTDLYRARNVDEAAKLPHLRVDVSDGVAKVLPALKVSKVKTLQVIASLPDGQPAAGATAIIKDVIVTSPGPRPFVMPPRRVDKSESVITNRLGRADLLPQGSPSGKAFVEVKLATGDQAYDGSVLLTQAVDGVVNVVLRSAWIVEGRVLIDGEPVVGAKVSIGESTPNNRTVNGRTLRGSTVSNFVHSVTDEKGLYRAAVSPGKTYSVSLQSLPGDEARPGIGYRPTPAGEGRLTVKDFAFSRGDQELAGRVIDPQGKAVVGAYVQVMRGRDITPSFWVGHQSESQHETDRQGRFHLKKMPAGTYQLTVRGPRGENTRRSASTMLTAKTGNMDVEVMLNAQPQAEIPRLQPKRIEPIQPSAGEQP